MKVRRRITLNGPLWRLLSGLCICFLALKPCLAAEQDITPLLSPPVKNGVTVVRAAFHLLNVDNIDDEAETFGFTGVLTLRWSDPRQAFDPNEAKVSEKIYQGDFQYNELSPSWFPQVILTNAADTLDVAGVLLRVKPDGSCTLVQAIDAVAKTQLNMRRYPFDSQRLDAVFEVLGFDSSEVTLEPDPNIPATREDSMRISQWDLTGLSLLADEYQSPALKSTSRLTLSLVAERQSFFMVRLVVFPLMLIVILSWSVFWMERSSLGDRLSVSFIGILTAVAYQIVLSDTLPHISYVTLINGFLNISFLLMSATVVVNLYVGSCDKRDRSKLGDIVDRRCRWIFPLTYFSLLFLITSIAFIFF